MLAIELRNLPIIDIDTGKKALGNNEELIKDVLRLLIDTLPNEIATIKRSYHSHQYDRMLAAVHRLHGAVCYSPTPRLKLVLSHLESHLKHNIIDELPLLIDTLENETKEVINARFCS